MGSGNVHFKNGESIYASNYIPDSSSNDVLDQNIQSVMTIIEPGLEIRNFISTNNLNEVTERTFISSKPEIYHSNLDENLIEVISICDDDNDSSNN